MSIITFLTSFLAMCILIPAIWYGLFRLNIFLKRNIFSRGKVIYTIIRFYHMEEIPHLMENKNFLNTGKWEYIPEAGYYKGFSKLSDNQLRQWIMEEYQLKPSQVVVSVPESMAVATAGY